MGLMDVVLLVLAVASIWAVVELAVTLRRARKSIEEVTESANQVIAEAQPIVAKLDGMVDELEPAVKEVSPLVEKTGVALDSANDAINNLNGILGDVSEVSGTASAVTGVVNRAADAVANGAANVVSKLTGRHDGAPAAALESAEDASQLIEAAHAPEPRADRAPVAYVDYGEMSAAGSDAVAGAGEPEDAPSAADAADAE